MKNKNPVNAVENDVVRVFDSVHTFENDTDEIAEFVVFRYVPDGTSKRELIKGDKVSVRRESGSELQRSFDTLGNTNNKRRGGETPERRKT